MQEKIDNITQNIRDKIKETQDTISDYQKAEQDKTDKKPEKKEDEKENGTNVVSEEDGHVAVKSAENANTGVAAQKEKE